MIKAFDTLVARVLMVSLLGITVFHALSLWTYEHTLERELAQAQDERLADRLLSIKQSVTAAPEDKREELAHDLSGGSIRAHWNRAPGAVAGGPGIEKWTALPALLLSRSQSLKTEDIVIGTGADQHIALMSLRLPDQSWLNVSLFAVHEARASGSGHLVSTSLMALGVALISMLMAAWLTRPLRRITDAVSKLSIDARSPPIPEAGPREVRELASSFNAMLARLVDLVERRTRALAAVSHDLRTPLTRLKLRLDEVAGEDLQRSIAADIDEMEQMIEATLAYLKGRESNEEPRPIDLVALLQTLVDDARDAGHDAELDSPQTLVITARHLGLKRALSNLIGNALRYATRVRVSVREHSDNLTIHIDDNGPGIPDDKLETVLEPFVRLEDSRNLETGGVGLGLTIAKSNIENEGGTLVLRNRPGGGLSAIITLRSSQPPFNPVRATSVAADPRSPG